MKRLLSNRNNTNIRLDGVQVYRLVEQNIFTQKPAYLHLACILTILCEESKTSRVKRLKET